MRTITLFTLIIASSLSLVACGRDGGGDDTGDDGDDTAAPDANDTVDPPDANIAATKQVGDTCTPDAADPMGAGDCGAGFTCLNLNGGNGPWCSKTCDTTADTCAADYTGTGIPQCVFGITFTQGGTPVNYCGVVCEDIAGDPVVCDPAAACDGTCPGTLQCSAGLSETQGGPVIANACI